MVNMIREALSVSREFIFSDLLIRTFTLLVLAFTLALVPLTVSADQIVFSGKPNVKVEIMEGKSKEYTLSKPQSEDYKVVITQVGDKFYWLSRQNAELIPNTSGFYITFTAKNGSGYIRTLIPEARAIFRQMSEAEQQSQYLYFEHLVHQMGSITYFGW
jgi:hypothetical protein